MGCISNRHHQNFNYTCQNHPQEPIFASNLCRECTYVSMGAIFCHIRSLDAELFQRPTLRTDAGLVLNEDELIVNSGIYIATFRRGVCFL